MILCSTAARLAPVGGRRCKILCRSEATARKSNGCADEPSDIARFQIAREQALKTKKRKSLMSAHRLLLRQIIDNGHHRLQSEISLFLRRNLVFGWFIGLLDHFKRDRARAPLYSPAAVSFAFPP